MPFTLILSAKGVFCRKADGLAVKNRKSVILHNIVKTEQKEGN